MQLQTLTLLSLPAVAVAQLAPYPVEKRQDAIPDQSSIRSVLLTAIPSSLLDVAATNPVEFSSIIASEFAEATPPAWFTSLPTDIQTLLLATPTAASSGMPGSSVNSTLPMPTGSTNSTTGGNGTVSNSTITSSTRTMPTLPSDASTSAEQTSTTSTGGAALPSAVIGAGIAGAIGFVGMLAL
ncbi:hypothetical protein K402DRAFT_425677 [Aulographum hederae CBS 113979]|uniref:FAS1 domain-containing protein n=1 Tax=Aulographum hederae CBS 113979 TaxID=1176131 RepID=A0A6G1GK39_9PEZI|nr:hypothetical protein K402DRAFT_425677 [Aulographum hederae CBS 113979]